MDDEDERLISIFKWIHINLPFLEAMIHMPKGANVLKDLISHKEKLEKAASSVKVSEECSAIIQRSLPQKEGDLGSFTLPCLIEPLAVKNALAILREKVCKNLLVKVSKFIFLVDFVVLEIDEDKLVLIILGWPFLTTARAVIDVHDGKLSPRVRNQWVDTVNHDRKWIEEEEEEDSNKVNAVSFYPRIELENNQLLVVISSALSTVKKSRLLEVLKNHKRAISWSIANIKGIDSSFCTHKILMEYEFKLSVQPQRRVNPNIKEVVVPKKGGITLVKNEKYNLIPQRTVTGWRMCIDYRKLNNATRKDHFPLLFIDQMLERLAGHKYYCFLDRFSGYFQILIASEDQDKTTCTCPYRTFAYKRMPFELSNAPTTFQRCMTAIFHELIEDSMEELRWIKQKIKAISKLPYPTNVKAIRSFLGHAGFYRRFIKDFSQIARPMTQLLVKDAPFNFSEECIQAFDKLKRELTQAPIMVKPDWSLPFEVMCDASDYVIGAVLGQRIDKHFKLIHYASKTMNEAQENYTTIEKELLAVVFAFDKFRQYLVLSKTIPKMRQHKSFDNVTTDHLEDIMASPLLQEKSSKPGSTGNISSAMHINKLDEMRPDAYESSISYKERTKRWHDKRIKAPTNYERCDKGFAAALAILITRASQSRQHGTDISIITRKPSKTGKHEHENRKSTKEAKDSKPKPTLGQFSSSKSHVEEEKHIRKLKIALDLLSEKAQGVTITDCHAGNPCVHICDPTAKANDPIIEGIQGVRLEEAWEALKGLEASAWAYKYPHYHTHTC
ncbi:DNA-directed DNA polymerase [Tanacetum coccineum]